MAQCGPRDIGPTGIARRATPGNAGKVMCSCIINGNKPIYKRRLQDQHLALSSGTLALLPQSIKTQLSYVPGLPGLILTPKVVNYDNYIMIPKGKEGVTRESSKLDLGQFEFPNKNFISPDGEELKLNGYSATINAAKPLHYMWIADGSIFSNYNVTPTACASDVPTNQVDKIKFLFSPRWEYFSDNESTNTARTTSATNNAKPQKNRPYQAANSHGDIRKFIKEAKTADDAGITGAFVLGQANGEVTVYKNLSPGIHWRVVKREALFQGEDFVVTFYRTSASNSIPPLGNTRFTLRPEFKSLDIYGFADGSSTELLIPGQPTTVPIDNRGNTVEEALSTLDFARQAYYIIELGALGGGGGTEKAKREKSGKQVVEARGDLNDHHYFIVIAENTQPTFYHVGRPYVMGTKDEGGGSQEPQQGGEEGQEDCFPDSSGENGQSPQQVVTPIKASHDIAVPLSTFPVSGRELMRAQKLEVQVRQHLGNIVVIFNNDYSNPWVIERQELTTKQIDPLKRDTLGAEDFERVRVPMIIPAAPIALMGGNRKSAFSFAPLKYISIPSVPLRQNLSVLGPVDMREINLLLRDKGYSKARVTGRTRLEFSQDAADYTEVVNGLPKTTKAMTAQADLETRFGKAPDQQRSRPPGYVPHTIELGVRDCSSRVGSEAPFVKTIQPLLGINAGSYIFQHPEALTVGEDPTTQQAKTGYILENCITPIVTGYRLNVPPFGTAYTASPVEVGHHVLNFNESWNATDFQKIEHTGSITFLVNEGMKFSDDQSDYLASLADKTFYIQVSIWWEDGVMSTPLTLRDKVVFTGLCHGGSITVENGKRIMSCDLHDYMKILKDQAILNSPFFDKMRDFNAIYEVTQLAGFRDGGGSDNAEPGSLIRRLRDSQDAGWFALIHNGEKIFNQEYALPGSYDILQQPFLRFSDAQHMYDAVERIADISGKMIYFDRLGVFHFEPVPDEQAFFNGQQQESREFSIQDYINMARVHFFASPREARDAAVHRQIFNAYTIKRNVEDVINEIRIISNTPNGELLLAGHTNFDSLFDANSPGFIGYPKQFLQMEGIFGSEAVVKGIVQHYTKMFIPPISISFEALGHNKVKALDIVTFKGLGDRYPQPLRIMSVKSEVRPESNTWTQNFECEWIFASESINWGEPSEIEFGPEGPI